MGNIGETEWVREYERWPDHPAQEPAPVPQPAPAQPAPAREPIPA